MANELRPYRGTGVSQPFRHFSRLTPYTPLIHCKNDLPNWTFGMASNSDLAVLVQVGHDT